MSRPAFITFEGGEGCGKTTQIARLAERLRATGHDVLTLREPGGTPLGESIRDLLKHHPSGSGMCPEAELLLFAASRAELVRKSIHPALAAGHWVLCDRFLDSTTVYQGYARGLPADAVAAINRLATAGTLPNLTLVLDMPPELALARARTRTAQTGGPDRMEAEPSAFYAAVREGFLTLAAAEPARIRLIPADAPPEVVAQSIWKEITHAFPHLLA
jgi:dTMP kinase